MVEIDDSAPSQPQAPAPSSLQPEAQAPSPSQPQAPASEATAAWKLAAEASAASQPPAAPVSAPAASQPPAAPVSAPAALQAPAEAPAAVNIPAPTPLQILVDRVHEAAVDSTYLIEFLVALYNLTKSRLDQDKTFLQQIQNVTRKYPQLLQPLNHFMPGFINVDTWTFNDPLLQTKKLYIRSNHPLMSIIYAIRENMSLNEESRSRVEKEVLLSVSQYLTNRKNEEELRATIQGNVPRANEEMIQAFFITGRPNKKARR